MVKSARKFLLCLPFLFTVADACAQTRRKPQPAAPVTRVETPAKSNLPPRETFHLLEEGELPLKARGAIVIDALSGAALYE